MSREIDDQSLAQSQSAHVRPFLIADLDYPDGMVRASTLPMNIVIGGNEYFGCSVLGNISQITEGAEQKSYGLTVGVAGVPGNFSAYLADQNIQGRLATIRLGFMDHGYQIIGQFTTVFVGRMDTQDVSAGKTSSVQVAIESLFIDWDRARVRRYTDVDQRSRYPDDTGFEFVSAMPNISILWNRS